MKEAERQLVADRELRNAAREVVIARVDRIRGGLAEKPVARRAADEAIGKARGGMEQAGEIAQESRWIIAAVITATLAWLLRAPLLRMLQSVRERLPGGEPSEPWRRWLEAISKKVRS